MNDINTWLDVKNQPTLFPLKSPDLRIVLVINLE